MRAFIFAAGLLLGGLTGHAQAAEPRPPGIGVRMTLVGPTFVDSRGMTLYQRRRSRGSAQLPCPDSPEIIRPAPDIIYDPVEEFPMRVPDAAARKSCTEKFPPLLAPAGAEPVGHWTIHQRENGMRQWAYRDNPLHLANKDRAPGDIHAEGDLLTTRGIQGWEIAAAPLDAPPGIETRLTSLGLALTNQSGMTLYQPIAGAKVSQNGNWKPANWKPVIAPMAARAEDLPAGWSIVSRKGGLLQWAWQEKPLYTYVRDTGDTRPRDRSAHQLVDVFGDTFGEPVPGWRAALLKPASGPPAGVRTVATIADGSSVPASRIYADARGRTLYVVSCTEMTRDRLDCDDVGDSPRYWLSFCGGQEICRKEWRPLAAPADAAPIDGLWSVAIVNPSNPYKPLQKGEGGQAVWTFRGRFVFTYAADEKPGDTWGTRPVSRQRVDISAIPAFAAP